jgi:predicted RNase H-like nuclease (RuvC/YqgF family)
MNPNKRAERIVKEYEDKNDLIPGYSVEEVLIGLERETKVLEKENLALKARAESAESDWRIAEAKLAAVPNDCREVCEDHKALKAKLRRAELLASDAMQVKAQLAAIEKDLRERIAKYKSGRGKGGLYSILLKELDELLNKHVCGIAERAKKKLPYGGQPEDENEKDG